jgi:ubiquinone/menaquinone biosynthesis C-methylase UbiE
VKETRIPLLDKHAEYVLRRIGLRKGKTVLDFGCGLGIYTIPAARMVGTEGVIYAFDSNAKALDELMRKARSAGLENITRIDASGKLEIEFVRKSIDIVLLFDVLHSYYFPQVDDRRKLLNEIYRILKPNGLLSVYPKHMEAEAKGEIESANFYLESEHLMMIIHDNKDFEEGCILNFRKKR